MEQGNINDKILDYLHNNPVWKCSVKKKGLN